MGRIPRALASRAWTALAARYTVWERIGILTATAYLAAYGCAHAPHVAVFAVPAAVIGWCLAAWWLAPPTTEPAPAAEAAVEEPPANTHEDVYAATLDWIRQQIGDRQAVHLRDLLTHAQAHGLLEDLDVTTFRAHLERRGFPIKDKVRVRGLGVTVGIHRDDLPPAAEPSPESDGQDPPKPQLHVA